MTMPSYDLSSGLLRKASVTAPQWQLPVYNFAFSASAVGSTPVNCGDWYWGSIAWPSKLWR